VFSRTIGFPITKKKKKKKIKSNNKINFTTGPIGTQKRRALSQHRVIDLKIDLQHKRILSMEFKDIKPVFKNEGREPILLTNNFGDDLDEVLVYSKEDQLIEVPTQP
jgi:hypothetical protein